MLCVYIKMANYCCCFVFISIFVAPAHLAGWSNKEVYTTNENYNVKFDALLLCCSTMKPFLCVRCTGHTTKWWPGKNDSMHILALKICNENWPKTKHTVSMWVCAYVCARWTHRFFGKSSLSLLWFLLSVQYARVSSLNLTFRLDAYKLRACLIDVCARCVFVWVRCVVFASCMWTRIWRA